MSKLLDDFENGVFEVLLAPVGSHERIVSTTADALEFQFYGRADPKDQLIDYLRAKEMLIVFDNFEHVMEGRSLLPDILGEAPNVSVLVTSREPLRITGEKVFRLQPLQVRDVGEKDGGAGILARHPDLPKSARIPPVFCPLKPARNSKIYARDHQISEAKKHPPRAYQKPPNFSEFPPVDMTDWHIFYIFSHLRGAKSRGKTAPVLEQRGAGFDEA